jgi:signal transduction histidine kinase
MSFLFAVDDECVSRGAPLRPVVAGVLLSAGVAGGGLTAWAAATSPILVTPDADAVVRGFLVVLYVVAGVYAWQRRRDDWFGPVLVLLSFTYALTTFNVSGDATLYSLGRVYTAAWLVVLVAAFLSFPSGRLGSRLERLAVRGFALATAVLWTLIVLLVHTFPAAGVLADCGKQCPGNAFRVASVPSWVARVPVVAMAVLSIVFLAVAILVLVRKAWSPTGVERRTVRPVLFAAAGLVVSYLAFSLHAEGDTWRAANLVVTGTAAIVLPIAFVLGPLRGELFVSRSLWRGLSALDYSKLTAVQVEDVCRRALGDPSLRLALPIPGGGQLGGIDGVPLRMPLDGESTAVTRIERPDGSFAVIHDQSLVLGYRQVVERVGNLAFTLIEYARVFRDVVLSRRRIVESDGEERGRLERDLHDGAQQRLLTIQMKLAELSLSVDGTDLAAPVGALSDDAAAAVDELRRVAHGIYPPLLLERGVADALRETPKPPSMSVRIVDNGVGRLPASFERAIYFSALEAIQNATKHSSATAVVVTIEPLGDTVEVTVEDDGVGFDPLLVGSGAGLTGIRDRIGSLGGDVEIMSAPGAGTVMRYLVPRQLEVGAAAP